MSNSSDAASRLPRDILIHWLQRQLSAEAFSWLSEAADKVAAASTDQQLYLAVSLVSRRIGKADLALTAADLAVADRARSGWTPAGWSADQAARLVLVLSTADASELAARLEQLFITADVAELVTFYRGLPLYSQPERYLFRAAEGARSNMKAVFEAVAHNNPYPAETFPEATWNQMVLKALFIGSRLAAIQRLSDRQNPTLARMLCDYAHERWAAGRSVSPELWRCVGPFADGEILDDLTRALSSADEAEAGAAALALAASPAPQARDLLARRVDLAAAIGDGRLAWASLAPR